MTAKGSHFINGQWIRGTGTAFRSHNPATGDSVWEGNEAQDQLVDTALLAARQAFVEWSRQDLAVRIGHLEAFRETLSKEKDAFARIISMENGKPLWDALTEVAAMINKVGISIEAYKLRCPEMIKEHVPIKTLTRHRPHGVMAVLGPFNFPGHIPTGHIVPALLAGNTVVFKPSEFTPLAGEMLVKIWESSGLPSGVINLVQGGRKTGAYLSQHSEINGLLFTGSWKTGKALAEMMAKTPNKILALEMGGNNPLIVSQVEDLQSAAYLTIQSAFLTTGQRCTCARRLIIPTGQRGDHFLNTLISMTKTLRVGPYTETPEPFMGPVISRQTAENLLKAQNDLVARGGVALLPMRPLDIGKAFVTPGLIDVTSIEERSDEEYFGPLLQVIRVNDFAAAIEEANHTQYGLTSGLLSDSREEYEEFYRQIRAGVINWNTPTTGATSAAPFGGIGHSGNNRPSGLYAADYCAYPVASNEISKVTMPAKIAPGIELVSYEK